MKNYMDKIAEHNGTVCIFNETDHSYIIKNTGQTLTSITALIKKYTPSFNSHVMAQQMIDKKKSTYAGMSVEEIIEQWEEKAKAARDNGTLMHAYAEKWIEKKGYGFHPKTIRVIALMKQIDQIYPKLLKRFKFIEAEKIIFSARLCLAGTIDLLMLDEKANEIIILDWKQNSKALTDKQSSFQKMLPPVEHLNLCDTVTYGLQLAFYEKILDEEKYYPEHKGFRKALIHVRPGIGKIVKIDNYSEETGTIIENYHNHG